ncbi:MAG: hypothetical protein N7Q72_06735, partial [Spiroplasma sp. Tabriz.8]|nr:hypothetical protein [Spiroplasma sp. Tabriz.8]
MHSFYIGCSHLVNAVQEYECGLVVIKSTFFIVKTFYIYIYIYIIYKRIFLLVNPNSYQLKLWKWELAK